MTEKWRVSRWELQIFYFLSVNFQKDSGANLTPCLAADYDLLSGTKAFKE